MRLNIVSIFFVLVRARIWSICVLWPFLLLSRPHTLYQSLQRSIHCSISGTRMSHYPVTSCFAVPTVSWAGPISRSNSAEKSPITKYEVKPNSKFWALWSLSPSNCKSLPAVRNMEKCRHLENWVWKKEKKKFFISCLKLRTFIPKLPNPGVMISTANFLVQSITNWVYLIQLRRFN